MLLRVKHVQGQYRNVMLSNDLLVLRGSSCGNRV
jgi:hypothetical protein